MREGDNVIVINDLTERAVEKNIYNLDWVQGLETPYNYWCAKHIQELLVLKWKKEVYRSRVKGCVEVAAFEVCEKLLASSGMLWSCSLTLLPILSALEQSAQLSPFCLESASQELQAEMLRFRCSVMLCDSVVAVIKYYLVHNCFWVRKSLRCLRVQYCLPRQWKKYLNLSGWAYS